MFFAKGEIIMNNIYKVIWSKAKNCYVVASEIARSHTKSASGSEKIGGDTGRKLLASLMVLSLLCGGLGVAEASVHVNEVGGGTSEVYTTSETYKKTEVDLALAAKGAADDVATNKAAIIDLKNAVGNAGSGLTKEVSEQKAAIAANTTALDGKANKADVYSKAEVDTAVAGAVATAGTNVDTKLADYAKTAEVDTKLAGKADKATTLAGYGIADAYSKGEVDNALNNKADKATTLAGYGIADAYTKGEVDNALNKKADKATTLAGYGITDAYTKAEVNTAVAGAVTTAGTNVDAKLADYAKTTYVDTEVGKKADKATTLAGYGITDAYTKSQVSAKLNQKADKTDLTQAQTAIDGLNKKTTKITYDASNGTSVDGVTFNAGAVTGVTSINGTEIGTKESGTYIHQDSSNWGNMKKVDTQVKTNADNIETNKNDITKLDAKVGTVSTGTYLDPTKSVGENLGLLDAGLKQETADRKAAIGELAVNGNYIEKDKNVSDNLVKLDNQTKANADEIVKTNERTGSITRNTEKTQTTIEGSVKVDKQGNVKDVKGLSAETITTTGNADLKGNVILGTNTANTVTVNGNADFNAAVKMNNGLNVTNGETNLKKTTVDGDLKVTGTITTDKMVFGDPATNNYTEIDHGKVTSKNLVVNGAGQTISSSSTFDVEKNEVGFTNTATGDHSYYKQTAKGINGYVTDKDGNKTYTKVTATENSFQVQDKDGKNKNHQVNTKDSSVTEITNGDGKTTKTEQTALDITNTAKDGTITNDAKDIVNNASGNMTNAVGGDLKTTVGGNELHEVTGTKTENVTGKVTENYKNGQETNVTGDQDIYVTGKQTNKIDGDQVNTIGGNQTTTVTGDISNKAENITNEANMKLTDKVGDNTRVLDSEGITDTVPGAGGKGSIFRQRIDAIMGNVKTDAGESEMTQTGDEITSVVGKGEATNSRVTQKKGSLEAAVTDGTNTNVSYDVADASAKVLTGGTKVNKLQDNLDSSEKTITNGIYTTSKLQTALDITNTAKDGTITNDAKNIVNNATGDMTNTVGGKLTTTVTGQATENFNGGLDTNVTGTENHTVTGDQNIHVTGNQTTTVTGDISNKAENITNEANTKLTDKVGTNTRVLDSEGITDTVPGADGKGSTFKQRIDAIMGNVKTDAGESEVTQKGDEITSVVGKGEATNSRVTQKKGSLEAAVTDGINTNVSYDVANASAKELTDGTKVNKVLDNLDSSEKTITNGTYKTSKLQTALDITNTAKDGTITNDAKNIVNNATGDMTNTVGGKLTTTVTGQATENFKGGLKTDITGEEIHTVTGNQTNKVTGKQTNTVEGGQENIISGGQINNITGDQTTTISGTQTTTATDINRNVSSSMVDKVDNAYGTNTETKVAGKTTTDVSIKGTGEKGEYIRGANESRDYLIKGTLKNSETKTAEATSTKITDSNGKTSSTIQDVTQISGSVTDGTNTSVSNVKANSIDSAVTDGSSISTINQKKNSITSQVTDGTTITKTEQDTKNITNTAKDGTITNDAKDIVNNASGNMTNTVGGDLTTTVSGNELHEVAGKQTNKIDGDQENTIGGNQTTTVTGDISNKAENITNEANTKLTDKVGENTRVLDSEGITDTVGGSTFKQRIDKIMMESKDVSIKAEETLTNEAKVITNRASEVINNEAVNINNTATGIITSKASEIKNQADKLISNKVSENTWENMENGKITTSIKDGAKQNLTQSDAAGTTQSTVDGGKSTVTIQNADGLADAVTDGTNTSVQNQTASAIAAAVKDGAGNENASVANATTSANTIKSGSKANTVISTADGTSFINSKAAAPVGDGTEVKTTIKGNTITTGKVTMDYADVMKDLGVRGNANITGKTTTGSLEVTGTSTLKGDVTMGSNATVKKDLTVEGNTNLKNTKVDGTLNVTQKATFGDSVSIAKDLSVDGNATIKGDVTAKSYKVGDKTYISAAGINANDQKITNVADGSISEGSKDAVNGGQLYTVKNDLEGKVNKVGANAAAMANLHPMEFDPSSKWNIAAAIGNYGSETAAALGAFYRPNDNVMVNLSTAFGTGENMVGGGVSVRLGKGGNKLSREENNALKAQVDDLTARMDALLSVLNPNMSKDFPDVPENHWAYEAVSRLAGNDIVQGYPDGEFHGERTMTRYEMAEIIYNALSRGAEAERELVEEFKPELQAMAASEKATAERAEG